MMSKHGFTLEKLIAYAAGELDADATAAVEAHLRDSAEDARRVERLRRIIATMRSDDSVAPSAEALARAKALFEVAPAPTWRAWIGQLEQIVARLVYDSRTQPALAGYRGGGDAVQLSFESETATIDLELVPPTKPPATKWTVLGQLATEWTMADVLVLLVSRSDDDVFVGVRPDEHGVFMIRSEPGTYDLLIRFTDKLIRLPDIDLR
jgi:hypothetical protein